MNTLLRDKKKASECENPLALQNLGYETVILSISTYLGFVECFLNRGRNDTEPRACQAA